MVNEMKSIKKERQEEFSKELRLEKSRVRVEQEQKRIKEKIYKKTDDKKLYESELFDSGLFVRLENGKTVRVGEPTDPNNPQDTLRTFNYFEVIDDNVQQVARCLICAALMEKGIETQDPDKGIVSIAKWKNITKWKKRHVRIVHPRIYTKRYYINAKENGRLLEAKRKKIRDAHEKMGAARKPLDDSSDDINIDSILEEEFTVGEPSPNVDINKSVYFSHNYYRRLEKGSKAICLMCLASKEKKKVLLSMSGGSTKSILGHLKSFHIDYAKNFFVQRKINQSMKIEERGKKKTA